LIFKGYPEISWITRDALTNCDNFECALSYFVSTPIIAPGYLTVAGVKNYEGAIISRDKFGAAHIEMLSNKSWTIVQTNDDHFDGTCNTRCQVANANMQSVGFENINADNLRHTVMLAEPTLNDHTIFSSILIPALGSLDAIPVKSDYPDIS